jgi:DNA-binding NtrC family response regulator
LLGRQVTVRVRVGDEAPTLKARDDAELVGESVAMQKLRNSLSKFAPSSMTVLIEGETGTGKEVVARAIHKMSTRSQKPFVVFDCAAVSPSLIASELFGHVKGAYTGAVGASDGAFRAANGGTLFLDEIGELPLDLQPSLLRALEARQVKPVGGDQYLTVDVRVVAATNRSLEDEVEKGRFRRDLLFRLAVGRVKVAPLRQRIEDIPRLVEHFARSVGGATFSKEALMALSERTWSGNVRELRNMVERSVMLCAGPDGVVANLDDLEDVDELETEAASLSMPPDALLAAMHSPDGQQLLSMSFQDAKQAAVENFEKEYLVRLFEASGYNLSEAGRRSGVHRRYLRELFKKHNIDTAAMRDKGK